MFVRTKKAARNDSIYIQIVESYRQDGRMRQRVIRHVGTIRDLEELVPLKQLAEAIKAQLENETKNPVSELSAQYANFLGQLKSVDQKTQLTAAQLEEVSRHVLGIHDVYGALYEWLHFSNPFTRAKQRAPSAEVLREIVLARIAKPTSKRSAVELLEEQFGVSLPLHQVYKMMDKIDDAFCERIQKYALSAALQLEGRNLNVLFFDATTLYFESFTEDEFKQNGYSKDMKFNQPQVLLALLVTEQGLPVGYEVFPGASFEGHTLIPALEKLKTRYAIQQVVIIADRGMLNEANLTHLEEHGFHYIVAAKLKGLTKVLQTKVCDKSQYQSLKNTEEDDERSVAQFEYDNNRRLMVSWSAKRARKDQHDREKAIEKLTKKLSKHKDPKSLLSNYGYKKYLSIQGKTTLKVNETKIKEDAKWDGLHGVITNIPEITAEQATNHYRGLWRVEECFRVSKHDLKLRPIFHFTPRRVRAHLAIAFMALTCVRHLEYRVALQYKKLSPEVIRKALWQVQASVIRDKSTNKCLLLPSRINAEAKHIYRVVKANLPPGVMEIQSKM